MVYNYFFMLPDLIANILLRIFASKFMRKLVYNFLFFVLSLSDFGMRIILVS